jgi:hypothetical protein
MRRSDDGIRGPQYAREEAARRRLLGKDEYIAAPEAKHEGSVKLRCEPCRPPSVRQAEVGVDELDRSLPMKSSRKPSQCGGQDERLRDQASERKLQHTRTQHRCAGDVLRSGLPPLVPPGAGQRRKPPSRCDHPDLIGPLQRLDLPCDEEP